MLEGFRSRWMIPFWWACWTAWQTGRNRASRSSTLSRASSQYLVKGMPFTNSMTKNGRPLSVGPPSRTLAIVGWSMRARGWRSDFEAGQESLGIHAGLDELEGDFATDRLGLFGHPDGAHAAFADLLQKLVAAGYNRADALAG